MNDKFTDEELSNLFGEIPRIEIDDELNAIIAEFSGKKPETARPSGKVPEGGF